MQKGVQIPYKDTNVLDFILKNGADAAAKVARSKIKFDSLDKCAAREFARAWMALKLIEEHQLAGSTPLGTGSSTDPIPLAPTPGAEAEIVNNANVTMPPPDNEQPTAPRMREETITEVEKPKTQDGPSFLLSGPQARARALKIFAPPPTPTTVSQGLLLARDLSAIFQKSNKHVWASTLCMLPSGACEW